MHIGKTLLNHIDSEETKRIEKGRQYKMPPYRTGDIVQVTTFNSLSEGKFTTFSGLVYSKKMPNNLRQSFKVATVFDEVNTGVMVKVNSPLVAKIEVQKYGSNKLRKKMNHIPGLELTQNRLLEPIVKGRNYKARTQTVKTHPTAKSQKGDLEVNKGKVRRGSV